MVKSVLRWLFRLLITAMLIAIIVPLGASLLLDQEEIKTGLNDWMQAQGGRTLSIDGRVGFRPGLALVLFAEDVRMENVSWGSRPDAFNASRVEARISLPRLLRGRVVVEQVEISGATVWVERSPAGLLNFGRPPERRDEPLNPIPLPSWLGIERLQLEDAQIICDLRSRTWDIRIDRGELIVPARDEPAELSLQGSVESVAVTAKGTLGTLENWFARADSAAELMITLADRNPFTATGRVGDVLGWRDLDIGLAGHIDSVRDLTRWFRSRPIDLRRMDLSARLRQPDTVSSMALEEISGTLTWFDVPLRATGRVGTLSRLEDIDIDLAAHDDWDMRGLPLKSPPDLTARFDGEANLSGSSKDLALTVHSLAVAAPGMLLSGEGRVESLGGDWGTPLPLALRLDEVSDLGTKLGRKWPILGGLQAASNLGRKDGGFVLDGIELQGDGSLVELAGQGVIRGLGQSPVGEVLIEGRLLKAFLERNAYALPLLPEAVDVEAAWQLEGEHAALRISALEFEIPGGRISAFGDIPDLAVPVSHALQFSGSLADPGALATALSRRWPPLPPLQVSGVFEGLQDGTRHLRNLSVTGERGAETITASGTVERLGSEASVELEVSTRFEPELLDFWLDGMDWFATLKPDLEVVTASFRLTGGPTAGYALGDIAARSRLAGAGLELGGAFTALQPLAGGLDIRLDGRFARRPGLAEKYGLPPLESAKLAFHVPFPRAGGGLDKLDATLALAGGSLSVAGDVATLQPLRAEGLELRIRHPDLAALLPGKTRLLPEQALFVSTKLSIAERELGFEGSGRIGHDSVRGTVTWDMAEAGGRHRFVADLQTDRLDLRTLIPPAEKTGRFFSADPLVPGWMRAVDGDIRLRANRFQSHPVVLNNLDLHAEMDAERVLVVINAGARAGALDVILERAAEGATSLTLKVDRVPVESLRMISQDGRMRGGVVDADISISGSEDNLASLMASGKGYIRLEMLAAKFFDKALQNVGGDLMTNVISAVNPFEESKEYVEMQCGAIYLDIADGLATTRNGIAIKTDHVTVLGGGEIAFPDESLKIVLAPKARKGLGISATSVAKMIRLGGTLGEPRVEADSRGILMSGVALGAAILSGGASLVAMGLIDRLHANTDVCAIARGEVQLDDPAVLSSEKLR